MPKKSKLYLCEEINKNLRKDLTDCQSLLETKNEMIDLMQHRILRDNTFINELNKFYSDEKKLLTKKQKQKIRELICLTV